MLWHDASRVQYRQLRQLYARQQDVVLAPSVVSFAYYATCAIFGSLSWGHHLRMVTFRHDLGTAIVTGCALCDAVLVQLTSRKTAATSDCGLAYCTHRWLLTYVA